MTTKENEARPRAQDPRLFSEERLAEPNDKTKKPYQTSITAPGPNGELVTKLVTIVGLDDIAARAGATNPWFGPGDDLR